MTEIQSPVISAPAADRRDLLPSEFVFVYGTLKKGFERHSALAEALFVSKAVTKTRLPLVVFFPLPVLINRPHKGRHIWGEVYKVSRKTLNELDAIEGHPQFYKRHRILVTLSSNRDLPVWVYFLNDLHVPEGVWQGLPFLSSFEIENSLP